MPIELFVQPIFDSDGELLHYRTFVTDISERKRADEESARRHSVLSGIATILEAALDTATEEHLGEVCLSVAKQLTDSQLAFIGEIGNDGLLHDIAMSDMAWRQSEKGHLNTGGKRIYEDGIRFLAGEIAASRGIEYAEAEQLVRVKLMEIGASSEAK